MSLVDYKYDGFRIWHEREDGTWSPVFAWRKRDDGTTEYDLSKVTLTGVEYFKLRLQGKIKVTEVI